MGTLFRQTPNNGVPLSAKTTLKDGYGFGGFSRAPPSKQHLSTPPPPGAVVPVLSKLFRALQQTKATSDKMENHENAVTEKRTAILLCPDHSD